MAYRHKEKVEVCKRREGGGYMAVTHFLQANALAAIDTSEYIVRYQTRYEDDKTTPKTETVHENDVRPWPPMNIRTNYAISEKVDIYYNYAWWVGRVSGKFRRKYAVRLDYDGSVVEDYYYRLRAHMTWEEARWVEHDRPGPAQFRP